MYKAVLRDTNEEVAIKVQRPGVEPTILRDLYIFRTCGGLFNALSRKRLGCDAQLIVDEFGEKLLEELDYTQVGWFIPEPPKSRPTIAKPKPQAAGVAMREWECGSVGMGVGV